jgi:glyoxylase-like metal-dependent hydrolase (beta-lactamase superfamily II)
MGRVQPEPLDLCHQDVERVIGVYLLETAEGPALFDCGPASCIAALKARLAERGLALTDVRHLLLSHIHLDHAGAAGMLVREHPALQVHVSEIGAPHLVDPSRLERSARRLYGDAFDRLWGELAPVPERNVRTVGARVLGLDCFPSPGHASHHVCYVDDEGTLYAGDAAGVRIQPARYIAPVSPPPETDVEAWERTLDELQRRRPARLALIHFGVVAEPDEHLPRTRDELRRWAERVGSGMSEADFVEACRRDLETSGGGDEGAYELAAPFWQSYAGLERYWQKRGAAETPPAEATRTS